MATDFFGNPSGIPQASSGGRGSPPYRPPVGGFDAQKPNGKTYMCYLTAKEPGQGKYACDVHLIAPALLDPSQDVTSHLLGERIFINAIFVDHYGNGDLMSASMDNRVHEGRWISEWQPTSGSPRWVLKGLGLGFTTCAAGPEDAGYGESY